MSNNCSLIRHFLSADSALERYHCRQIQDNSSTPHLTLPHLAWSCELFLFFLQNYQLVLCTCTLIKLIYNTTDEAIYLIAGGQVASATVSASARARARATEHHDDCHPVRRTITFTWWLIFQQQWFLEAGGVNLWFNQLARECVSRERERKITWRERSLLNVEWFI